MLDFEIVSPMSQGKNWFRAGVRYVKNILSRERLAGDEVEDFALHSYFFRGNFKVAKGILHFIALCFETITHL
jgi:hypothetical protein